MGKRDSHSAEENIKIWNNTILSAEYRKGTDYWMVDLLDSVNMEINVGDNVGGTILHKEYKLRKDTIIVIDGIDNAGKYLISDKFLIYNRKLLFKIDKDGSFDTSLAMDIKFNKIKL